MLTEYYVDALIADEKAADAIWDNTGLVDVVARS